MSKRKGIILAGGAGTRLHPMTTTTSKQLMPVYDKPMIYYPLSTLMMGGIRDIMIITTPNDQKCFKDLLGDGRKWGINLSYTIQEKPDGIASAFILAEEFIKGCPVCLILGDNLFYGKLCLDEILNNFTKGACITGYLVRHPERYGVVEFDDNGKVLSLEEKPENPKSNYVVPGLYIYDENVSEYTRQLTPSERGELEITDLNKFYLEKNLLKINRLGRNIAWLDTGTPASMLEAANFVKSLEDSQGLKISCPEEIAWRFGYIDKAQFQKLCESYPNSTYTEYLQDILKENIIHRKN